MAISFKPKKHLKPSKAEVIPMTLVDEDRSLNDLSTSKLMEQTQHPEMHFQSP